MLVPVGIEDEIALAGDARFIFIDEAELDPVGRVHERLQRTVVMPLRSLRTGPWLIKAPSPRRFDPDQDEPPGVDRRDQPREHLTVLSRRCHGRELGGDETQLPRVEPVGEQRREQSSRPWAANGDAWRVGWDRVRGHQHEALAAAAERSSKRHRAKIAGPEMRAKRRCARSRKIGEIGEIGEIEEGLALQPGRGRADKDVEVGRGDL